jgi:predicted PurR-regulated permease PerM
MSENNQPHQRSPAMYAIVLVAAYLTFLVLSPFLAPLIWAVILGILFHGWQGALARRMRPGPAALVTTLVAGVIVIAPAVMLISAAAREMPQLTSYLQESSQKAPEQIEHLWQAVRLRSPMALPEDPAELLSAGLSRVISFVAPRAGGAVAGFTGVLGSLVTMLFALFFMLRDGEAMSRQLREWLPFSAQQNRRLMDDTRDLVIASVGTGLIVAAAQGAIGGIAFWLLGLGAPVLWAVVIAVASLLPVVGSALVWVPAALWLLLSADVGRGLIMLLVGVFGISMVDNVLRPFLLSGKAQTSTLVIFFGLLGGVAAFGFVGLVVGPVILVTTGSLLKMFRDADSVEPPR